MYLWAPFHQTHISLKFSFEKNRIFSVKAYLKSSFFTEYEINSEAGNVQFTVNLSTLLNCIQIFGSSSLMQMTYEGIGDPLSLFLEEDGIVTQCEIATIEEEEEVDFNFRSSAVVSRAVVKSQYLKQVFAGLFFLSLFVSLCLVYIYIYICVCVKP